MTEPTKINTSIHLVDRIATFELEDRKMAGKEYKVLDINNDVQIYMSPEQHTQLIRVVAADYVTLREHDAREVHRLKQIINQKNKELDDLVAENERLRKELGLDEK